MSGHAQKVDLVPGLYFLATPIGNARDITLRVLDILASAEVLAAEDTRRLRQLMDIHGVSLAGRHIVPYHDHNGPAARPKLLDALAAGKSVAYASDAGSPIVADPGHVLAREAIAAGHPVFAAPGPVAAVAALTVAGLPSDRFTFAGFPPQAKGARTRFLDDLKDIVGTLILYESPNRVAETLGLAAGIFGDDRPAVLARELTKKFEEVRRGTLEELQGSCLADPPRGEIVLLIGEGSHEVSPELVEAALVEAMTRLRLKDAAREVAERFSVSRRDLYQRGLELQGEN